jgi:hypothetical protein
MSTLKLIYDIPGRLGSVTAKEDGRLLSIYFLTRAMFIQRKDLHYFGAIGDSGFAKEQTVIRKEEMGHLKPSAVGCNPGDMTIQFCLPNQ